MTITNADFTEFTKNSEILKSLDDNHILNFLGVQNPKEYIMKLRSDTSNNIYDLFDYDIRGNEEQLNLLKDLIESRGDICLRVKI